MVKQSACYIIFGILICLFYNSCFPPNDEAITKLEYSFNDPEVRQLLDSKDKHQKDTLLLFLKHEKASLRYLAALSFASFRDSTVIPELSQLLNDPVEGVKQAAVYSLGQIAHVNAESALIKSFLAVDSIGPFNATNSMILEALGKCGSDSTLSLICNISSYTPDDTLLLYGQMLAFYRFGLRDQFCKNSEEKILQVATNDRFPSAARLIAAQCLQRFKYFNLNEHSELLKKACNEEKNPDIRMCLITAFARISSPGVVAALEELYSRGLDIRIQSNILRGLQNQQGLQALYFALKAIQNPSLHVSIYAAQFLLEKGNNEISEELKKLTEQTNLPWQVKSIVYEAALNHIPGYLVLTRQTIEWNLKAQINQAKNPYEKAAYLKALATNSKELPFLISLESSKQHAYLRTTLAECIEKIMKKPDFTLFFKGSKNGIYQLLSNYFTRQCEIADPGILSIMASLFSKSHPLSSKYFKADSMLQIAQSKLSLPRDIETYNDLGKCIASIHKTLYTPKIVEYNHPIQWNLLEPYRDTIHAIISTNKGDLNIDLYPKIAPASVINFIQLCKDSFYNEKIFHRVVPNFVVQVGCPRGDGYGSLDYTIRTEISLLNYQESGMIGMASAGADTEGVQFFITHSPAPHLDGRYTIFGKMTAGNDVLMSIHQSDQIKWIQIK
ncbi:MAG: peptidylprolyl isomerase [Saprospiraceae bacterium]